MTEKPSGTKDDREERTVQGLVDRVAAHCRKNLGARNQSRQLLEECVVALSQVSTALRREEIAGAYKERTLTAAQTSERTMRAELDRARQSRIVRLVWWWQGYTVTTLPAPLPRLTGYDSYDNYRAAAESYRSEAIDSIPKRG